MRWANHRAALSRRTALNIDIVLRISTAFLMTFAAALVLAHAECYFLGALHPGASGRTSMFAGEGAVVVSAPNR
jgi:hypothetical protein